jgi:hypothetical protein
MPDAMKKYAVNTSLYARWRHPCRQRFFHCIWHLLLVTGIYLIFGLTKCHSGLSSFPKCVTGLLAGVALMCMLVAVTGRGANAWRFETIMLLSLVAALSCAPLGSEPRLSFQGGGWRRMNGGKQDVLITGAAI